MDTITDTVVTKPAISLPQDQYAHPGAPTEWWWHVGTLVTGDGHKFGFEVNATGMVAYGFTQICITDVEQQKHYQNVNPVAPLPQDWAQADTSQPWSVRLGGSDAGTISMTEVGHSPLHMEVKASFTDAATGAKCAISLHLQQHGKPLLVWGNGCEEVDPQAPTPLTRNNYYYSLTRLAATGTVTVDGTRHHVTGHTWMDHEYGAFPKAQPDKPVIWTLQDMQLNNGVQLSNFTQFGIVPEANVPMPSHATILDTSGHSTYVETRTTPLEPVFVSKKGVTYYLNYKVEFLGADLTTVMYVKSLVPDQLFLDGDNADVYEGVGSCEGTWGVHNVTGTAWIEQNLG
ncbi:MAG: lipocalin-like domain-containing protein [Asticcacaulis sp.]